MKPPAPVEINRARQIVDDCVDIGANAQAKELNVVPDVTDVGKGCRVVDVTDATCQPGSSCATAYYANHDGLAIKLLQPKFFANENTTVHPSRTRS
jgi:hypothetical protein